jgi:hypothetical protein
MASGGTTYTVLFFIYDPTRIYGLCAPSGPTFDSLTASFVPLA